MPAYDEVYRKSAQRRGRERGCWVYIPAIELEKTGIAPMAPPPTYNVWGRERGSVLVRLYKNDNDPAEPGRV